MYGLSCKGLEIMQMFYFESSIDAYKWLETEQYDFRDRELFDDKDSFVKNLYSKGKTEDEVYDILEYEIVDFSQHQKMLSAMIWEEIKQWLN